MKNRIITYVLIVAAFFCGLAWNSAAASPDDFDNAVDARIAIYIAEHSTASNVPNTLCMRSAEGRAAFNYVFADGRIYLGNEPIAGDTLLPIQPWDGEQSSLPNKMSEIIGALNLSRTGIPESASKLRMIAHSERGKPRRSFLH